MNDRVITVTYVNGGVITVKYVNGHVIPVTYRLSRQPSRCEQRKLLSAILVKKIKWLAETEMVLPILVIETLTVDIVMVCLRFVIVIRFLV